jgi:hypothetical protein
LIPQRSGLPDTALKEPHQKVFEVKPPRASVPFWRLLRLGDDPIHTQHLERKLTAVFSGDAACS